MLLDVERLLSTPKQDSHTLFQFFADQILAKFSLAHLVYE